jgi:hypothetical protein
MALPSKFSGSSWSAEAETLDFIRDDQGNPAKTPYSFSKLQDPLRTKMNAIIDHISATEHSHSNFSVLENITDSSGVLKYNGAEVGNQYFYVDGGYLGDDHSDEIVVIDGGDI